VNMKIVVTGATGFVGQSLVPALRAQGADLLLVGRSREALARIFPDIPSIAYADLPRVGRGYELIVHLAVLNNDVAGSSAHFDAVNVDFLLQTVDLARRAEIGRFINVSSLHSLTPTINTAYANSKRTALARLAETEGIAITTLFLPPVHGERWAGKLSVLNGLPSPLAKGLFKVIAAVRPTVSAAHLARYLAVRASTGVWRDEIVSDGQIANPIFRLSKRTIDLAFALAVLVFGWWLLALVWAAIKLQSPGPGIFTQERVGRGERVFTCYKFRTMRIGTAQAGTHEVSASSVTPLGAVLRRTKIDELPQIWNIFRNEISLIGPRPSLPTQTLVVDARRRYGVFAVKPGISGLAQVNGIDMSMPDELAKWDARYMATQSLALDLRLVIETASGRGNGDRIRI
jgi:lipopolysaccharide/colanic/teichoic acid biosynthesis glycosyltransferase/uncharacterized protein YbjT (DUF2867 family)